MGFDSEVVIFESALGPENCVWAQVERENTDFSNDSRNYCRGVRNTLIVNDSDVDTAAARLYGRLVNQFAWTF